MSLRRNAALGVVLLGFAAESGAQTLAELLPRLLSESVTMPSTTGNVAGNPHEAHFLPSVAQLAAPYALNGAIVSELSTFPTGSSSGGFTYTLEPPGFFPRRSSSNFGPSFAERALTIGRGRFSAGVNYQRVEFDAFQGLSLEDGEIRFQLRHNECCPGQTPDGTPPAAPVPTVDANPAFEGDLIEARLSLDARTETFSIFANYGLTNHLDVSVAIPIVRVELDATMVSTVDRLGSAGNTGIHTFVGVSGNPNERISTESGSASGIGDVLLRAKYNFWPIPGGGLAAGLDLRLPTGDEDDLLGTGATQFKTSIYYSGDYGKFAPHVNLGYTFSSGGLSESLGRFALGDDVPTPIAGAPNAYDTVFRGQDPGAVIPDLEVSDEFNYTIGFVAGVSPRMSIDFDLVGRWLLDVDRFELAPRPFPFRSVNGGAVQVATRDTVDLVERNSDVNLLIGVAGFKLNVTKTLLINAHVIFPLSDSGLRAKVAPVIGIDYAF